MDIVVRFVVFLVGVAAVVSALRSAIVTFVLPREGRSFITRRVFLAMRIGFNLVIGRYKQYVRRDRIMAIYAPLSLLALMGSWMVISLVGFMAMFWATGAADWASAYKLSLSSLFTLGFAN